jgi:hypothetical protein
MAGGIVRRLRREPGAGRRRWPFVLLAGGLGLTVTGVAVTAGGSDRHPGRRTYRDHVVDPAGAPGASAGAIAGSGATAVASSPADALASAGGGTGGGAPGSAGQAASSTTATAGAPAGTGPTGTGPPATAKTTGPPKSAPAPPPTTRPGPARSGSAVAAGPGWRIVSQAPIGGRSGHAATWTGREMVVWGGQTDWDSPARNDGAAYDPAAATWRRIGPAPLSGRLHALTLWTGREVLVWGGLSDEGEALADGAAWDPATSRWRRIASSPLGARDGAAVVWTGDTSGASSLGRLVVWGGLDWESGQERKDGAAYDPAADRWIPMTSGPLSPRGWAQAGWTGSRVVISGGIRSDQDGLLADAAAWDPATGQWAPVASRPVGGACTPEEACAVVWTGTRLLLSDSRLAYDPSADRWTPLSGSPEEEERWTDESTLWTGSRMITWGGHRNEVDDQGVAVPPGPAGVVYDPAADRWDDLENGPFTSRAGHTAVWTGQDMLVWGGSTADVGLADGAAYRPA